MGVLKKAGWNSNARSRISRPARGSRPSPVYGRPGKRRSLSRRTPQHHSSSRPVRKGGVARAAKRRAQIACRARILRHVSALDDCPSRRTSAFKTHRPPAPRRMRRDHRHHQDLFLGGSGWIVPPCAGGFFPFVFSAAGWPVSGLSAAGRPPTLPGGPTTWCNLFLILAHRAGMGDVVAIPVGFGLPPSLRGFLSCAPS